MESCGISSRHVDPRVHLFKGLFVDHVATKPRTPPRGVRIHNLWGRGPQISGGAPPSHHLSNRVVNHVSMSFKQHWGVLPTLLSLWRGRSIPKVPDRTEISDSLSQGGFVIVNYDHFYEGADALGNPCAGVNFS
eukprot:42249-Pyramimonas_sp.AAC.1